MNTVLLSAKIPQPLKDHLESYADTKGVPMSAIVIFALEEFMGIKDRPAPPPEDPEFWPSGWPKALRLEKELGPVSCHRCDQYHDPLDHPEVTERAVAQAKQHYQALKAGIPDGNYFLAK